MYNNFEAQRLINIQYNEENDKNWKCHHKWIIKVSIILWYNIIMIQST